MDLLVHITEPAVCVLDRILEHPEVPTRSRGDTCCLAFRSTTSSFGSFSLFNAEAEVLRAGGVAPGARVMTR
jgi:hypothetical protein